MKKAIVALAAQLLFGTLAALPITSYLGDRLSSRRLEPLLS